MTENGLNAPIFSVSEVSSHLKRVVEDSFSFVRVRGEISGFKRAGSGHLYFRLKDDEAVLDGVCWRGSAARLSVEPEDGLEVIATGRLTTYPGRSNYQIVVESMEVAGEGALLKLLQDRRLKLAAEGLFDADQKQPIPMLPEVIGVVTSPTGAVIRDILHRLNDRFPRHVLVWPVLVQGDGAAQQIVNAIAGFNRLKPGGPIPRPDVLIVARGGGSLEDLWAFNEEIVVRAAFESAIPLISAVGHETDTTLIDFASDLRAPTPTAAAEMAVPVRSELVAQVQDDSARLIRAAGRLVADYKSHLQGLSRGLPDLNTLMANQRQRLDDWGERLGTSLQSGVHRRHRRLAEVAGALSSPRARITYGFERLDSRGDGLLRAARRIGEARRRHLQQTARLLDGLSYERVLDRGFALVTDATGKAVTDAKSLSPGDDIRVKMKGGDIAARVTGGGSGKTQKKPKNRNHQPKMTPVKEVCCEIFLIVWTLFALPFTAEAVELNGTLAQGGLVVGHAQPGSVVTLDGQVVAVAANGAFVMGFARDAEATARLKVIEPGGSVEEQTLSIAKQTYQVQRIDGLPTRKVTPNPADVAHIKADNAKIGAVRRSMSTDPRFLSGFHWPVSGPISGVFGSQRILNGTPKSPHNGVDVAAPRGSTIQAPADGVVALVANDMFYTGKTMMIDHGLGLTSVYAHMDDIFVIEGQVLSQGDALGTVGQTGRATGPHLHWGLTWKSVHVDPRLAAGAMGE